MSSCLSCLKRPKWGRKKAQRDSTNNNAIDIDDAPRSLVYTQPEENFNTRQVPIEVPRSRDEAIHPQQWTATTSTGYYPPATHTVAFGTETLPSQTQVEPPMQQTQFGYPTAAGYDTGYRVETVDRHDVGEIGVALMRKTPDTVVTEKSVPDPSTFTTTYTEPSHDLGKPFPSVGASNDQEQASLSNSNEQVWPYGRMNAPPYSNLPAPASVKRWYSADPVDARPGFSKDENTLEEVGHGISSNSTALAGPFVTDATPSTARREDVDTNINGPGMPDESPKLKSEEERLKEFVFE